MSVINITDVFTSVKVLSYPHLWPAGLSWLDYQLALRCAFLQFGLPERVSLDHDSAFYDNTCASPFPARLHLWLVGLGIGVRFIHHPPPQEHARIERLHQTMSAQALTGQRWSSQIALWQGLERRRDFLNLCYPARTLAGQAPLQAFPQAAHNPRVYRPEWEAELFALARVYAFLAQGHWLRETSTHGEFILGMQRYNTGRSWAHGTVEITFDPLRVEFVARKVGTAFVQRFPAKGLSKTDLMGDLPPFERMPNYQLSLPFGRAVWRKDQTMLLLSGTTE